jgi:hypothetical protein
MLWIYLLASLLGNIILSEKKIDTKRLAWLFASPLVGISTLISIAILAIPLSLFSLDFRVLFASISMVFLVPLLFYKRRHFNLTWVYQILLRTLLTFAFSVLIHEVLTQMFVPIFTYDSFEMLEASRDIVYGNIDLENTALANWSLSYIGLQIIGVVLSLEYVKGVFGVILVLTLISVLLSIGPAFRQVDYTRERLMTFLSLASFITLLFSQIFQTMVYYQNGHSLVIAVFTFMFIHAVQDFHRKRFQFELYHLVLLASLPLFRVEGFIYWLCFFFYANYIKVEKKNLFKIVLTLLPATVYFMVLFFVTIYSEVPRSFFLVVPVLNILLFLALYIRDQVHFLDAFLERMEYIHIALMAYCVALIISFDAAITSLYAMIVNLFFSGLWGIFWISSFVLLFILLQSDNKASVYLVKNFFLAPFFLILFTGSVRGVPFRLTWGDSGNRMVFHLCLVIPILAFLNLKSKKIPHA